MTDPKRADPKQMAKALRGELSSRFEVDASHSECLEIVARQHGVDNWNILAAQANSAQANSAQGNSAQRNSEPTAPWSGRNTTIPILRVFAADAALQFYVDFIGCTLDFGGASGGSGTPYYGQVSYGSTTLHLAETAYDASQGSTVFIWLNGIDELRERLNHRRTEVPVWGPAVWTPEVEQAEWNGRVLTIADPFGNHLRFSEPNDPAERAELPRWA